MSVENYRPILLKNAVAKIVDGLLFGDMLAASLQRNLTLNLFAYRTSMEAEDAILRIREEIISESQNRKNIAVISWDIKGAFEDLPHAVVLK